ncbi:hypothetical protein QBC35DRAFT_472990 [Podospora australis]|uniref:C2H2-type domain-containing protein n=1 Tax=Podospora australis TaxID=1536484 RepID=A0AAN6WZ68_9PEZI|nr:hypothetical protein QBC35DRAFT_472990 [Podospora australis]
MADRPGLSGLDPHRSLERTLPAQESALPDPIMPTAPARHGLSYPPSQTKSLASAPPSDLVLCSESDTENYILSNQGNLDFPGSPGLHSTPRHFDETVPHLQQLPHRDPVPSISPEVDTDGLERVVAKLSLEHNLHISSVNLADSQPLQCKPGGKSTAAPTNRRGCVPIASKASLLNKRSLASDERGAYSRTDGSKDSDEGSDDDANAQRSGSKRTRVQISPGGPFNCPFRVRNRRRFNCVSDHSCANTKFDTITKVKYHVGTNHTRPETFNCLRCHSTSLSSGALTEHLQSQTSQMCTPRDRHHQQNPEDGITREMETILRSKKNGVKVSTWDGVWRVIFPQDTHIPSGPIPDYRPCGKVLIEEVHALVDHSFDIINRKIEELERSATAPADGVDWIQQSEEQSPPLSCQQALGLVKELTSETVIHLREELRHLCVDDDVRQPARSGRTPAPKANRDPPIPISEMKADFFSRTTGAPPSTDWAGTAALHPLPHALNSSSSTFMDVSETQYHRTPSSTANAQHHYSEEPAPGMSTPSPLADTYMAYTGAPTEYHIADTPLRHSTGLHEMTPFLNQYTYSPRLNSPLATSMPPLSDGNASPFSDPSAYQDQVQPDLNSDPQDIDRHQPDQEGFYTPWGITDDDNSTF